MLVWTFEAKSGRMFRDTAFGPRACSPTPRQNPKHAPTLTPQLKHAQPVRLLEVCFTPRPRVWRSTAGGWPTPREEARSRRHGVRLHPAPAEQRNCQWAVSQKEKCHGRCKRSRAPWIGERVCVPAMPRPHSLPRPRGFWSQRASSRFAPTPCGRGGTWVLGSHARATGPGSENTCKCRLLRPPQHHPPSPAGWVHVGGGVVVGGW